METQELGIFEITVSLGIMVLWAGGITWANEPKGYYLDPYVLKNASHQEKKQ